MKTKTPIKILTLTLFVCLISGFIMVQSGFFSVSIKRKAYLSDQNDGLGLETKPVSEEKPGLSTFQKLKLAGEFDPENFDTLYISPALISKQPFLSSSKSALVPFSDQLDAPDLFESFFEMRLKE